MFRRAGAGAPRNVIRTNHCFDGTIVHASFVKNTVTRNAINCKCTLTVLMIASRTDVFRENVAGAAEIQLRNIHTPNGSPGGSEHGMSDRMCARDNGWATRAVVAVVRTAASTAETSLKTVRK